MAQVRNHKPPALGDVVARKVMYVGDCADEICHFVTQHVGEIDIRYEGKVGTALLTLRSVRFDTVIIDLRDNNSELKLFVPLVREFDNSIKIVVISAFNSISSYLGIAGVARVLAAPVREGQFLRVVGLASKHRHFSAPQHHIADEAAAHISKPEAAAAPRRIGFIESLANRGMVIISTIYKRAAFVLLVTLFSAFLFYGFLIAFFLLSTSWGAPMTLTSGHELVNKVEKEITEIKVALSQTDQRLTEATFNRVKTERDMADAKVMVEFAAGTVTKEIAALKRNNKVLSARTTRLQRVRKGLERQLGKTGMQRELDGLYDKRLIDKKTYNSSALGMLEADQRLAAIESELETLVAERDGFDTTLSMLQSLATGLEKGGPILTVTASTSAQIALTQQAVEAKAAYDNATERLSSSDELIAELTQNRSVLMKQQRGLEQSALARAINSRIDVIFVPYTNQYRFTEGRALYSCTWTVFWCENVGVIGAALPGEVASVHPFFGKPIRGAFVEAKIADPEAAAREIIHAVRPPFFF
jgi:hypothetical protein